MASNLWFTSDSHFSHENIIRFCCRPFAHAPEMNEVLIEKWNRVVRPQDHIYHLGDVSMCRPRQIKGIMARLHGHKRLIRGNHDIFHTKEYLEVGWEEIYGIRVIDNLIFTHIPIHPSSLGRFAANVHGHIHNLPDFPPVQRQTYTTLWPGKQQVEAGFTPYINISVEVTDYTPVTLDWIKQKVKESV